MTGVGRTTLVSEIDSNRSIIVFASIFNKQVSLKDLTKRLNEKLLTFDRFKSKVTTDTKYFELIPNFDCSECMKEEKISADMLSKYDSVKEFIEETLSSFANRPFVHKHNKPLWRLHVFQFESLKKTIMIFRCHHCICDGITFGEIWFRLSDNFDEYVNDDKSSSDSSLSDVSVLSNAKKCNDCWHKVAYILLYSLLWFIGMLYVLCKMSVFAFSNESQTIFKTKLSEQKYVSYISDGLPLDKINKKRKTIRLGKKRPTFNDYMLTVVAETIMGYLDKNNEYIPDYVHLAIPVDIRDKNVKLNDTMLGNKIGSYIIKLPLSKKLTFMQKLKKIKSELDFVKKTPEAKLSFYGIKLLSLLPKMMADFIGPKMSGGMTLVASNVKGAAKDMFMCGAKVTDAIGIVPPPMGVGLGFVIFTFNGKIIATVNVDKNCYKASTAKDLMKCFQKVMEEQGCADTQ
eukprot:175865_1